MKNYLCFKAMVPTWLPRSRGIIILPLWHPGYIFLHWGAQGTGENVGLAAESQSQIEWWLHLKQVGCAIAGAQGP